MKKTVLSIFISLLLICGCSAQCVFATTVNDIDNQKLLLKSETEQAVMKIVRNIGRNEKNQLDINVTDKVQTFLNEKQDVYKYVREVNSFEKENLKVKTNLLEEKQEGSKYTLLYAVETQYNYKGEPVDEVSGEGFEVQVVIDLEKNQLTDIYEKENAFDEEFRGSSVSKATEIVKLNKMPIAKTIADKADKFKEEVLEQKKAVDLSTGNIVQAKASYKWLSGANIKKWARNNFNKQNPSSGGKGVPYYDFSKISGNYDCTNFVSHALLAGGANVYKPTGSSGVSSKGWYYSSVKNRSSSWSGVANLHSFLTKNTTKGPAGTSSTYSSKAGTKGIGDIIQCYNGSVWRHSVVVTDLTKTTDGRNQAKVTGRTSKTQNNNNQLITEIYPNKAKRTISALRTY